MRAFWRDAGAYASSLQIILCHCWLSIGSKIIPCYWVARLNRFSRAESAMMGTLMNTRALMELIVLNVGYSLGFLPQTVFAMLVIMAVTTTLISGPLLKLWLPRPTPVPA